MPRHKHADVIIAWAEGKTIQTKGFDAKWHDIIGNGTPYWGNDEAEFRIKPEKKVGWINIYNWEPPHDVHKAGTIFESQEIAHRAAGDKRVACIRIEYEEGQGL